MARRSTPEMYAFANALVYRRRERPRRSLPLPGGWHGAETHRHHFPGRHPGGEPDGIVSPRPLPAIRLGHADTVTRDPSLSPVGFCGGYTTFSTFSYETLTLLEEGEWARGGIYAAISVLLALGATMLGFLVGRGVIELRGGG